MPNFSLSRNERVYLAMETTYGTAVAASNSNCCRIIRFTADNDVATIVRPDKTGTRTTPSGSLGRKFGKWSAELSLAPNGAAGTKPDCDPFLQGVFGQTGTVSAGVSVTYSLSDNIKSFTGYSYRQPSTIDQRASIGSIVQSAELNIGQDGAATWSLNGESLWVLESNQYSVADTIQKGGLGSFAAEPGAPVTNGGIIAGFTGSISIGGNTITALRTAKVNISTGNALVKDTFGTYYASQAEGDARKIATSFSLYEDDSSAYAALVAASESKTPVAIQYVIGTVAGSIVEINLVGVQLGTNSKEEQRRYIANFNDCEAHGTGNKDEINIVWR